MATLVKVEPSAMVCPKPTNDYIFVQVEAELEVRMKSGEVIRRIACFNDFYGFETSVKEAIKEAGEYAARHGIDQ